MSIDSANRSNLADLEIMLQDMDSAPELYQPTQFWRQASIQIVAELREKGVEGFRSHSSALQFYVPQYKHVIYRKSPEVADFLIKYAVNNNAGEKRLGLLLESFLSGMLEGFSDYRVFVSGDNTQTPWLSGVSESLVGEPGETLSFGENNYSKSFLNYLRGLVFLKKHANTNLVENILEIGGGFGTLGEIFLKSDKEKYFYVNCDVPPLAFISAFYLKQVFGDAAVADYRVTRNMQTIDIEELRKNFRAVVLCGWQLPRVVGDVDLFVNFISFQEMEPDVVQNYIHHVQRLTRRYALIRNLREGMKKEPPYTVERPIVRNDYVRYFSEFDLVASDVAIYGEKYIDGFHSDTMIFHRK